eukprot:7047391-Alexandrium_andersonii.AAC.1
MVRESLGKPNNWNKAESFNYRTFANLVKGAAMIFRMPEDAIVLFSLTTESDKSQFESCWIVGEDTVAGRGQGSIDFPPGPPQFVTVAGKNGDDVSISPL